ncbi:MAG TPA: RsmE family RNA methyltransferase [Candidatus Baltobacteraceae bacterium]|nr:RsmE family RNA methyltransferase [Candidatus Baltobacteraceae bacterium]
MPARRFFVEGVRAAGERIAIDGGDAHKIVAVLRLRDGDAIELVDSAGTQFDARVHLDGNEVSASLLSAQPLETISARSIDVAQAIPKGQKMDFVVEKATELGAHAIIPFSSERSVAHALGTAKVDRWRRLARAAAQQCGRRFVPEVASLLSFDELLQRFGDYNAVLFPWELAPAEPPRGRLPKLLEAASSVLIVVGPEGGFSHAEAGAAEARGAHLLWLGARILRTETAAMVLLAILEYL